MPELDLHCKNKSFFQLKMIIMKRIIGVLTLSIIALGLFAQENDTPKNMAEDLMSRESKLTIGGYGSIDFNQPLNSNIRQNGKLDVHRMVLMFGYKFNDRTQFVTEIELEHVKEVFVEQAFLDYKINDFIHFRGGLMLIPMGIINQNHEPTTFNGVERPLIDGAIAPTTWREIGAGFTGNIKEASLKYQLYVVNGFNGYNGAGTLRGKDGLRKGRQKGAESFMSSPNITARVDYYGISGLTLGVSGYFGNTQSTMYNGINKNDEVANAVADSTVVGISMVGLDARYNIGGLHLRGQYYFTGLSNTDQYNKKTGKDLGKTMTGFYVEAGYNVFNSFQNIKTELIPFVRYQSVNTHASVTEGMTANDSYKLNEIAFGLGWKMSKGAMLKADMQLLKSKSDDDYKKTLNMGIAIWF